MNALPVSDETHARAVALQEADGFNADTLIGLALDAFELQRALHEGDLPSFIAANSDTEWRRRWDACRDGKRYVEIVPPARLRGV